MSAKIFLMMVGLAVATVLVFIRQHVFLPSWAARLMVSTGPFTVRLNYRRGSMVLSILPKYGSLFSMGFLWHWLCLFSMFFPPPVYLKPKVMTNILKLLPSGWTHWFNPILIWNTHLVSRSYHLHGYHIHLSVRSSVIYLLDLFLISSKFIFPGHVWRAPISINPFVFRVVCE